MLINVSKLNLSYLGICLLPISQPLLGLLIADVGFFPKKRKKKKAEQCQQKLGLSKNPELSKTKKNPDKNTHIFFFFLMKDKGQFMNLIT